MRPATMQDFAIDTTFGRMTGLRNGRVGAPRLLALHGWLDNAASFVPLAPYLAEFDLVALDLPGHGASLHLPVSAEYTQSTGARAALAAADALGWDEFLLMGHSMGGAMSGMIAAAAPHRVRRLALIEAIGAVTEAEDRTAWRLHAAFTSLASLPSKQLRVFPDVATAVKLRMHINGLSEPVARLLVERGLAPVHAEDRQGGYVWRSDPRLTLSTAVRMTEGQVRDILGAIGCPTHVLLADPSHPVLPDALRRERYACLKNAELVVRDGVHHLHMEDPGGSAERLVPFLQS